MLTTTIAGKSVPSLGYGCFALSGGYGDVETGGAFRTLQAVMDAGVRVLDTSDAYAAGENEALVGRAVADRRHAAVIVTKFGWVLDGLGNAVRRDSSPAYVRQACEASLRRLQTDYIDVYLQHRADPGVPIEDTVAELERLQGEGKILTFGLCEVSAGTLRRAHSAGRVKVLQTEYSLWSREPEADLLPLCAALGITFMAYSPLGRGFLTGTIRNSSQLDAHDFRRTQPRFADENLRHNLEALDAIGELAVGYGCTRSQLALAWLLNQSYDLIPIPSTRSVAHFEENLKALDIRLTPGQLREIASALPPGEIRGGRHPAEHMKTIDL